MRCRRLRNALGRGHVGGKRAAKGRGSGGKRGRETVGGGAERRGSPGGDEASNSSHFPCWRHRSRPSGWEAWRRSPSLPTSAFPPLPCNKSVLTPSTSLRAAATDPTCELASRSPRTTSHQGTRPGPPTCLPPLPITSC